ncbi:MAG: caspase family protein [Rhizonema sp. NSF051]|nr:caspase family protein [Rhizonema sp. NSF051]
MSRAALVVGINQYSFFKDTPISKAKNLTTPATDAEAIAQLLETFGNFQVQRLPKNNIDGKLQVDPDAAVKVQELEEAITNLFLPDSSKIPEIALLFFAGHGLRKPLGSLTQGFLATSDASPSKNWWGMPLRDLWDILQQSQVKQQVIWLDCCFAGELLNFKDTELGRQGSGCDRAFIAASRDYEVAYQQLDGKHGVLTGALLAGLNPNQVSEYEWITNRTLAVSVEQKLQVYYENTKIPQSPLMSNHGEAIKLIQGRAKPQIKSEDEEISYSEDSFLEDKYQLRVALHWLIRLLQDDTIESIQVDSTVIPGKDSSVTMDNIVVCYKDGRTCFIQVKKNQPKHEAWSFSDRELQKELCKGRDKLESRENSKVKFYSCSPFGELKKLIKDCEDLPEYSVFHQNASKNQLDSLERLAKILDRREEITYSLVQQISFGPTYEFDDWERQNQLDLEQLLPNANLGMLVLERYIQSHETYLRDTKHVIQRLDVLAALAKYGLNPTPKRSEAEILAAFKNASTIGRYWIRKIDDKSIPRSELSKLIQLIEQGSQTILLIDRPGSGKTCLLLDLADYIEQEKASVWGLLFIKGDQFTNVDSEQKLVAQGLPEDIVGQCARLADFRQVIVIIDSLDVLSLSRQHDALKVFLGIIDRLEKIDRVTVIIACRDFDLQYDPLLRGRKWQHRVNLQPLDFDNEVKPFLIDWNVDVSQITPELQALLQLPQNLRIYKDLAKLGIPLQQASAYELYNSFLEEVVVKKLTLGTEAIVALQNMAQLLMQKRTQKCSKVSLGMSEDIVRQLISQEVLLEKSPGVLAFSHQTLADCITVQAALAKNQTLAQFILDHPQLPFIRPAVRAFFFYLRASQADDFRRQVWEVLSHDEIAYHPIFRTQECHRR